MMQTTLKQILAIAFSLTFALLSINTHAQAQDGYTDLIDGVSLDGWNIIGSAN